MVVRSAVGAFPFPISCNYESSSLAVGVIGGVIRGALITHPLAHKKGTGAIVIKIMGPLMRGP